MCDLPTGHGSPARPLSCSPEPRVPLTSCLSLTVLTGSQKTPSSNSTALQILAPRHLLHAQPAPRQHSAISLLRMPFSQLSSTDGVCHGSPVLAPLRPSRPCPAVFHLWQSSFSYRSTWGSQPAPCGPGGPYSLLGTSCMVQTSKTTCLLSPQLSSWPLGPLTAGSGFPSSPLTSIPLAATPVSDLPWSTQQCTERSHSLLRVSLCPSSPRFS